MTDVAMDLQHLQVEDGELSYTDRGSGEPVLLVHAGVFADWFAPLAESRVLHGCRVIRVRRAGYTGRPVTRPLTVEDAAHHCAALIAHLGLERVHYVGHSSSGLIGLQLALDHPAAVQTLTLLEPAPGGALSGPAHVDFAQRVVGPAMGAFTAGDLQAAFNIFMDGVGGPDARRVLEGRLGGAGYQQAVCESAFFFANEVGAVRAWHFGAAEAAQIGHPTLVVEGGESRRLGLLFPEVVATLAGLLPHARTARLAGVNHLLPLQDPDGVGRLIAAFVRRHPIAPRPERAPGLQVSTQRVAAPVPTPD